MLIPVQSPDNVGQLAAAIDFDDEVYDLSRRTFDIYTYSILRKSALGWDSRIAPINEVLNSLDNDTKAYLTKVFVKSKRDINHANSDEEILHAIKLIDERIGKFFKNTEMKSRIRNYVVNNERITLPDLSDIGRRIQDTPEMTFVRDDYDEVNTIIMIAKLLFPLFGEIIKRIRTHSTLDNNSQEIITYGILRTVLHDEFGQIIDKLTNYIKTIVDSALTDDPMISFYGLTPIRLTHDRLAKMIIKNAVNFNLYQDEGNIIRYIAVTIRKSISTETSNNKNITYYARISPDNIASDDARKVSFLENESIIVKEALEIPILIKSSMNRFINEHITEHRIDPVVFDQSISFYNVKIPPPSIISEFIVATFIAGPIGSAYSLKYIDRNLMHRLIAIVQLYAIRNGFANVAPLLTMIPSGSIKTKVDDIDNVIITSGGRHGATRSYYVALKELTAHLEDFPMFKLDEHITNMISYLTSNVHYFNLAPAILNMMPQDDNRDLRILKYGPNIMNEIYHMMYFMLTEDQLRKL